MLPPVKDEDFPWFGHISSFIRISVGVCRQGKHTVVNNQKISGMNVVRGHYLKVKLPSFVVSGTKNSEVIPAIPAVECVKRPDAVLQHLTDVGNKNNAVANVSETTDFIGGPYFHVILHSDGDQKITIATRFATQMDGKRRYRTGLDVNQPPRIANKIKNIRPV